MILQIFYEYSTNILRIIVEYITQKPLMSQNNAAMGPYESKDEWVCNDDVGDLPVRPVDLVSTPATFKQLQLPISPKISFEQLQGKKRPMHTYLPAVLVNPCRPAVKRIKTEYNRRVSVIRCSIPDAYHKIKNLNYEIRKVTAPAEISRVQSELNNNRDIILRAQCQMRTAHQEKKTKLENIKTNSVFRYLTSKDKKAAKVAKFHQWSPFGQLCGCRRK